MFFRMTNLPAIFQAMINEILRDLINKRKVTIFVDDMLVRTETEEGYDEIVNKVLRRLEENDLYMKLEKCIQKVWKIGFLGVVIGPNGIEIEKEKINGVLSWLTPKNIREVRKFLGLANYYRRFVKDFAKIVRPMNLLTRKDVKQQWREEQEQAFNELKGIFTMKLVLVALYLDKEFRVEADTSSYTMGRVLLIRYTDKLQRSVVFISKSLSNIEYNYKIHDKKILTVVRYLETWRHFLEGTMTKSEIQTDHKNLEYFIKVQKLSRIQAQQALYLSRFDFILKHIPGSKIEKVDSLSRRPDWEVGVKRDNKDKTLVKPEQLKVRGTEKVEVIIEEVDLLKKVRQSKVKDDKVVKVVEEIKQAGVKIL